MNWRTQSDSCWRGSILRLSIPAYSHSCRWCLKFYINKTFLKISLPWLSPEILFLNVADSLSWLTWSRFKDWNGRNNDLLFHNNLLWFVSLLLFFHVNRGLTENTVYVVTSLSNFGSAHFGGLVGALLELIELTHRVEDETALDANMAKCTTDPGSLSSYVLVHQHLNDNHQLRR